MTALLLTDDTGWARLFTSGQESDLGKYISGAEQAGEPPFTRAFIVTDDGRVLPAHHSTRVGEYDEYNYATARITFTAMGWDVEYRYHGFWFIDGTA